MKVQVLEVNELESMSPLPITTTNKFSDFAYVHCLRTTALEARTSDLIYAIADPQRKEKPQGWGQKQMDLEFGLGLLENS